MKARLLQPDCMVSLRKVFMIQLPGNNIQPEDITGNMNNQIQKDVETKLKREELLNALEKVRPGLAKDDSIEQATSFAFMEGRVVTYNDEISVSYPLKDIDFTGVIREVLIYKFLKNFKVEEITLQETTDGLEIKADRATAVFSISSKEITLPIADLRKKEEWKDLPANFSEGLKFAAGACDRGGTMLNELNCVYVHKDGYIQGTDTNRIAHYRLDKKLRVNTFLFPMKSALTVSKMNPVAISASQGWIHFLCEDGAEISCRILNAEYYDLVKHLKFTGKEIKLPVVISEAVKRAAIFAKRDKAMDESVNVVIEKNRLTIEAESDEGWYKETLNMKYKDNPIDILITPYLFVDILNQTNSCIIAKDRVKFEENNWVYVSMLRQRK